MRDKARIPSQTDLFMEEELKRLSLFQDRANEQEPSNFLQDKKKETSAILDKHREQIGLIRADLLRITKKSLHPQPETPPEEKLIRGQIYNIDSLNTLLGKKYPLSLLVLVLNSTPDYQLIADPKTEFATGFKLKTKEDLANEKKQAIEAKRNEITEEMVIQIGEELVAKHLGNEFKGFQLPISKVNKTRIIRRLNSSGYLEISKDPSLRTHFYTITKPQAKDSKDI